MIGKLLTGEQTPCEMNPLNYLRVPNYELGTLGGISKEIGVGSKKLGSVPSDPLFVSFLLLFPSFFVLLHLESRKMV